MLDYICTHIHFHIFFKWHILGNFAKHTKKLWNFYQHIHLQILKIIIANNKGIHTNKIYVKMISKSIHYTRLNNSQSFNQQDIYQVRKKISIWRWHYKTKFNHNLILTMATFSKKEKKQLKYGIIIFKLVIATPPCITTSFVIWPYLFLPISVLYIWPLYYDFLSNMTN